MVDNTIPQELIPLLLAQKGLGQVDKGGIFRKPSYAQFSKPVTGPGGQILTPAKPIEGTEVGGGFDFSNISTGLQGLGSLARIVQGFKQNKLAQQQLALSREAFDFNRNASTKSYNAQLTDQLESRASYTGDRSQVADEIAKRSL